jgi:tetratricopeptide (TPR) repeat protein
VAEVCSGLVRVCRAKGGRQAVIETFSELIEDGATDHRVFFKRGLAYGALGRSSEAAEDFRKSIEAGATACWTWWRLALAELAQGDDRAYQDTCREMWERFGESRNPDAWAVTAWTCALKARVIEDESRAIALAEKAAQENAFGKRAYALWLYRAGRFEEAAAVLADEKWDRDGAHYLIWCQRAATYHRLGRHEEAKTWFQKAGQWRDEKWERVSWNRRVIFQVLYEEAQELLEGNEE